MKKNLLFILLTAFAIAPLAAENPPKAQPDTQQHQEFHKKRKAPRFSDKFFSHFPEEERKRLKELEEKDPEAFRKAIREHFRKKREQEHRAFEALRQKYLNETDPDKKAAAKEEIRAELVKKMNWHIKIAEGQIRKNEKHLEMLQKHQEKLKKDLERMNRDKEKIVDKILTKVLDPAYEPKYPPRPPRNH